MRRRPSVLPSFGPSVPPSFLMKNARAAGGCRGRRCKRRERSSLLTARHRASLLMSGVTIDHHRSFAGRTGDRWDNPRTRKTRRHYTREKKVKQSTPRAAWKHTRAHVHMHARAVQKYIK